MCATGGLSGCPVPPAMRRDDGRELCIASQHSRKKKKTRTEQQENGKDAKKRHRDNVPLLLFGAAGA